MYCPKDTLHPREDSAEEAEMAVLQKQKQLLPCCSETHERSSRRYKGKWCY